MFLDLKERQNMNFGKLCPKGSHGFQQYKECQEYQGSQGCQKY